MSSTTYLALQRKIQEALDKYVEETNPTIFVDGYWRLAFSLGKASKDRAEIVLKLINKNGKILSEELLLMSVDNSIFEISLPLVLHAT